MKFMSVIAAGVVAAAGVATAHAQQTLATQFIASGLTRPVWVGSPNGDNTRLFVIEDRLTRVAPNPYTGRIRWINLTTNTVSSSTTPYLTISDVATTVTNAYITEQGILGMAFHPDFLNNGYFYVHRTRGSDNAVMIERYRANAPYATSTTADPASVQVLLTIAHPQTNHNGGWITFGPDGYLYFAVGDGGNGNDTGTGHSAIGNGQDLTTLLGKISRIDVDGPDNIPGNADDADTAAGTNYRIPAGNPFTGAGQKKEIWAYGLRNPWRNSFDRATGDLWIGDVGQDNREEIDVALGNPAGRNYGWKCQEGFRCTGLSNCPTCPSIPGGVTPPIADYDHVTPIAPFNSVASTFTGIAVTGGYVYRGCQIPWFRGHYIFTDYGNPTLLTFTYSAAGGIANLANRTNEMRPTGRSIDTVVSFGEDNRGELYIVDQTGGEIYKIVPGSATPDCTVSECGPQDFNGDGDFGTDQDIEAFFACLGGNCCPTCWHNGADFNGDGDVGTDQDIEAFFRVLGGGTC